MTLKKGEPLPDGTVLTLLKYRAQLDPGGDATRAADGHFVKGELVEYAVMTKRHGFGVEHAPEPRNGGWQFQVFAADGTIDRKADLAACSKCHQGRAKHDFLFSADSMRAAE